MAVRHVQKRGSRVHALKSAPQVTEVLSRADGFGAGTELTSGRPTFWYVWRRLRRHSCSVVCPFA